MEQEMIDVGETQHLTQRQCNDRAALTTQDMTTLLNLRPRNPDLSVMRLLKIVLQSSLQCTVCDVCETQRRSVERCSGLVGKFPVAELEVGRTRELDNVTYIDAFDEISELPRGDRAYAMGVGTKFNQGGV